jgi:hypothetical protein
MKRLWMCLAWSAMGVLPTTAQSILGRSGPLTTDESSEIDQARTYTHAISGGAAATVNGVAFALLNSAVTPANFAWTSTGGKAEIVGAVNGLGSWDPGAGGVAGPGLHSAEMTGLLDSFTYAPQGAEPGSSQTFTLSGLTIGVRYDLRLYFRVWDTAGSGRPVGFLFTAGSHWTGTGVSEDRPGLELGTGNQHQAWFLDYEYTAESDSLVIDAAVPAGAAPNSGSFHLYALTNHVVPEPSTAVALGVALGYCWGVRRRR